MKLLRSILAEFLRSSQIKVEISGFDMDGFSSAVNRELRSKLDHIAYYALEDEGILSDAEKLAAIRMYLEDYF